MQYFLPEKRNPLDHRGTNRSERLEKALQADYVQIEERHAPEFIREAARLAQHLQYYDTSDTPIGDWTLFFNPASPAAKPHRALFLAFLELLELLHAHGNGLTDRHLDYYYQEVLEFTAEHAEPAQVHLFFECAKTLKTRFLAKGTVLSAGQDADGKEILFELADEIVVNKAKVTSLKTVFRESEDFGYRLFSRDEAAHLSGEAEEEGFPPFGQSQVVSVQDGILFGSEIAASAERNMEDAALGFAIASPMLRMEEGERHIQLRLYSRDLKLPKIGKQAFQYRLTTEEGWFEIPLDQVQLVRNLGSNVANSLKFMEFTLDLTALDPALKNWSQEVHGGDYRSGDPVLSITFDPESTKETPGSSSFDPEEKEYAYAAWKSFELDRVGLLVGASGLRELIVQNDRSLLDPTKPFRPFGPIPSQGDNFYIGHPEVFRHRLSMLEVELTWKDLPNAQLGQHYAQYNISLNNSDFQVEVDLLDEKNWKEVTTGTPLFDHSNAELPHVLDLIGGQPAGFERKRKEHAVGEWDHSVRHGFVRLRLKGPSVGGFRAFGHSNYPEQVMTRTSNTVVPQPYTPMLASVELSYATEEVIFDVDEPEILFQVGPFGQAPQEEVVETPLLTDFSEEGQLYIGLEELYLPQSVGLLFQMAEGSGDAEASQLDSQVSWSYLSGNVWKALDPLRISMDTTSNLIHSGLIRFDLPSDMDADHQTMPNGQYWLRASIPAYASGMDHILNVHAQGALATEVTVGGSGLRLEPGQIKRFQGGAKGIANVSQAYPSFEGRGEEDRQAMMIRTSERLRHKDRSVMIWDYERLVLQHFPEIWKVKCLNHTNHRTEQAPGKVMVALVPDLRHHQPRDPFQPKVGMAKRTAVATLLQNRMSPFIDLKVENPIYEPLRLSFNVGFHVGYDEGYYGQQLHKEVQEFLAPWAFDAEEDLVFGGSIHKSTILKFIEDRPYVDFVNDFTLYHTYPAPDLPGEFTDLTPEREGACVTFRFAFTSQNAPYTTSLIRVKVRLLNGILDLIGQDLEQKFITEIESLMISRDKKGIPITRSLVNSMVKSIYYVDRIVEVDAFVPLPDDMVMHDVDVARTQTGRSILTSSAQHRIGVYRAGDYQCEGNIMIGIGFMIVEADFIVS